jgi:hypothetical protein
MKISIKDLKKKRIEKLGKDVIEAQVEEVGTGVITDKVQIWGDFPSFETITFGSVLEGDLVTKVSGNFTNITLYPPKPAYTPKSGGMGGIKAAQERKEVMIEKAQERKSDSIAFFNATNSAIALVKDLKLNMDDTKAEIVFWREWFLSEYRKYEASGITDKRNAI